MITMRLTKKNESITIHYDNQSAVLREITQMSSMNITKKTTINLRHQLPYYNRDTMESLTKLYVGQDIQLLSAKITEIRVGSARKNKDYPVEIVLEHINGDIFIVDSQNLH